MAELRIDRELCIGCGLCTNACPSGALFLEEDKANVNENCVLCGLCRDTCPVGAIGIEKETAAEQTAGGTDVWVFAETDKGHCRAPELLFKGRELADVKHCRLVAVTNHTEQDDILNELIACGADLVLWCDHPAFTTAQSGACVDWLCKLIEERKPEMMLFPATSFGREVAPGVAVRIRTGLTADCTGLDIEEGSGLLLQTRPTFGGNLMATIKCPEARPQMATVRPGVLKAGEPDPGRKGETEEVPFPEETAAVKILEELAAEEGASIRDAERLVVVGRGIGSRKNLALFTEFAKLIGAEIACSRPLVEAGYLEYRHQVGQTGAAVAPKLMISIGVSGAIQHLAGIGGAEKIIAINTDPNAPIFSVSDVKVVGDGLEIVQELVRKLSGTGL